MVKASFVIPAKNAEAWIAETLESVMAQTYKDIEVIVVDDNSTDDTAEIVQFYMEQDKRIKLVENDGKGRSAARNYGNSQAEGEIILVLDSDDIALPNRVEETVRFFEENPDKDVFYSSFGVMGPLGDAGGSEVARETGLERARTTLLFGIGHSTMAYRKAAVDRIAYDTGAYSDYAIDDWKLQLDMHKAGLKFGFSTKSLAMYRIIPKQRDEKRIEELKRACLN